jgi:hypothetical protein
MADLVTDSMGQSMADAGGGMAPQQTPQQQQGDQLQQQQQDDTQAPPAGRNDKGPPRVKGTLDDRRKEILAKNPNAKLKATPDMQAEYIQVVTRFLLMLHDPRKNNKDPKTGHQLPSPMEAALLQMNNRKLSPAQAIGRTTAQLLFIMHHSIKMQKAKVNPNVWFRAADECVIATYLLGHARGIFEGVPKYKPYRPKSQPGRKYDFDPTEKKILLQGKLEAVRWFGKLMQKAGEISPDMQKRAQQYWDQQIKQEIASGKVTDSHVSQMLKNPQVQSDISGFKNGDPDAQSDSASASTASAQPAQQPPAGQQQGQPPGGAPTPPPAAPAQGMAPPQNPQGGQ